MGHQEERRGGGGPGRSSRRGEVELETKETRMSKVWMGTNVKVNVKGIDGM